MWGRTRVFPMCVVSWVESFCRVVCSGLARQSRTGLRYLLTIALAPTGLTLVNVCLVKVFLSRSVGIAPPPPHFCWRPRNLSLSYVLCTWPAIPRNLSLFHVLYTWPAIPRNLSLFYVCWWWRLLVRLCFRWGLAQCLCYRC